MQSGSWITLPADPSIVFDKDPTSHLARNLRGPLEEPSQHYADYAVRSVLKLAGVLTKALLSHFRACPKPSFNIVRGASLLRAR